MHALHSIFPFIIVDKKFACDVCHFAKHKRLHYHSSFNKLKEPFDIVHFDIWSPIAIKYKT